MDVGDEADAQAVERRRQAGDRDVLLDADQPMTLVRDAVGDRARGQPDARRDDRAQRVTTGEAHR